MTRRLSELATFLAVAEQRSFQRAAVARGQTRSAISHAIRSLEDDLGVRLLSRNTRSVSLTEAGTLLDARLRPAFSDIEQALEELNRFRDTPFGTVKITVPRAIGLSFMAPVIARLVEENAGLSLEVSSSDALVDIVAEGFDAGVRFGERLQQDMIATRIGFSTSFAVVASPFYARAHGLPRTPQDLLSHRCIRYRFPSGIAFPWEFERDGKEIAISVEGPVVLDDQDLMVAAAAEGAGLAFVFIDRAAPAIAAGRLVRCLEDWCPRLNSLYLYYPNRTHLPAGLRALIDMMKRPPEPVPG